MDDFREAFAKDPRRTRPNKHIRSTRCLSDFKPEGHHIIFGVAGLLVLVVLFLLIFGGGGDVASEELNTLKTKVDALEKRLTQLAVIEQKMTRLETRIDQLARRDATANSSAASGSTKNLYHEVRPGDTLSGIAEQYDISITDLCRFNNITPETVIRPGQKLALTPQP